VTAGAFDTSATKQVEEVLTEGVGCKSHCATLLSVKQPTTVICAGMGTNVAGELLPQPFTDEYNPRVTAFGLFWR
jgi:hypothetical protein